MYETNLSKYGVVDINYSNTFFTNADSILSIVLITFNKEYSQIQFNNMLDFDGKKRKSGEYILFKMVGLKYDFYKSKYIGTSNQIQVELSFSEV